MQILNNAIAPKVYNPFTFEDCQRKVNDIQNILNAGYKREASEMLDVLSAMLANVERQNENSTSSQRQIKA